MSQYHEPIVCQGSELEAFLILFHSIFPTPRGDKDYRYYTSADKKEKTQGGPLGISQRLLQEDNEEMRSQWRSGTNYNRPWVISYTFNILFCMFWRNTKSVLVGLV